MKGSFIYSSLCSSSLKLPVVILINTSTTNSCFIPPFSTVFHFLKKLLFFIIVEMYYNNLVKLSYNWDMNVRPTALEVSLVQLLHLFLRKTARLLETLGKKIAICALIFRSRVKFYFFVMGMFLKFGNITKMKYYWVLFVS